jgi:flagellar secretion chaperone FliS
MEGIAAYRQNAVETQSRGRIIVMLYEGAIRFLRQSLEALEKEDYVQKGELINKAIEVILELNVSLNLEAGGDIAQNLRSLYHFMMQHLTVANVKCDGEMIQDVINLLSELNEGWKQITE